LGGFERRHLAASCTLPPFDQLLFRLLDAQTEMELVLGKHTAVNVFFFWVHNEFKFASLLCALQSSYVYLCAGYFYVCTESCLVKVFQIDLQGCICPNRTCEPGFRQYESANNDIARYEPCLVTFIYLLPQILKGVFH
jgi:hypothetical protein